MPEIVTGAPEVGSAVIYAVNPSDAVAGAPVVPASSIGPSQAELWPFKVNWDEQVTEQIEFRTDIFETRSGREQRRALRTKPRWTYETATWAAYDKYQKLSRLIRGRGGLQFVFRHPVDWVALASPAVVNDMELAVAELPEWAQAGVHIILEDGEQQELCRIASATGLSITINGALSQSWSAGAKIRRSMAGRLDQPFTVEMLANKTASFKTKFMVDPDGTYELAPETAAVTFDGRELFLHKPNWDRSFSLDFDFNRETIDYGVGRIVHALPKNTFKSLRKATFMGMTREATIDLIRFFVRMKGQRGEFYAPSLTDDIGDVTSIAGGFINVQGLDLYRALRNDLTDTALFARKRDGSYLVSKISAVTNNAGNTRLTLTTSWGSVGLSTIMSISLMPLSRFASDSLTVDWLTNSFANIVMTFRTLENQASE